MNNTTRKTSSVSRKILFFSLTACCCLLAFSASGHTISEHLEEIYEQAYLPLFALIAVLPFAGIALLLKNNFHQSGSHASAWLFLILFTIGFLLGWQWHESDAVGTINHLSILIIGVFMLAKWPQRWIWPYLLMTIFGFSLGYENGFLIAHGGDFTWFYALVAFTGLMLFFIVSFLPLGKHHGARAYTGPGIFYIICGLLTLLLAN